MLTVCQGCFADCLFFEILQFLVYFSYAGRETDIGNEEWTMTKE